MDIEIFKKIIDEILENRDKVKSIALFMDGEPSLHKKLIEFLIYAKIQKVFLSCVKIVLIPQKVNGLSHFSRNKVFNN